MSIKTEEAKIVEELAHNIHGCFASAYAINEKVNPEWLKNTLTQALATYKVSILAECEKCVPEEIDVVEHTKQMCMSGNTNKSNRRMARNRDFGFNKCRTQTLRAINSLKV